MVLAETRPRLCTRLVRVSGSTVLKLRYDLGLTQEELAERAGLARSTISKIERGGHEMRPNNLRLLARALDVKPKALRADD